jgi:hypothetical protein
MSIYPLYSNKQLGKLHQRIPVWENGDWSTISFTSREEFAVYLEENCLREPGQYELDDTSFEFNKNAIKFDKKGYFCDEVKDSAEWKNWWNWERYKNRKGAFFKANGKVWYLPRGYYFWINFLKIIDKVKRKEAFPEVHDAQLHMSLYEFIAEVRYKHGSTLKKRQFGSSLYHIGDLINLLWFEESVVLKIGASLSAYITGINGNWKFAESYKDFLNTHTDWIRQMSPDGVGSWQQQVEVVKNGIGVNIGLKGTLEARSFEQSPTAGVGGLLTKMFYEEAGIAPTMDQTLLYMIPAMEAGDLTTGIFLSAGTVGDLKQCGALKKFMYSPEGYDMYTIPNINVNTKGVILTTPLFIPEQYAMKPYIDVYGNSMVKESLIAIEKKRKRWRETLDEAAYQLKISQHPINMEEAFAHREESIFPQALIKSMQVKIDRKEFPYELVELEPSETGVIAKNTKKPPITQFPVDKKMVDKSGSIVVWERPIKNAPWETYYGTVDPVAQGKTTTSVSLCSIQIYKAPLEVTRIVNGEMKTYIEGDKLVAAWCGRFDDINKTHERLELLIEWYNAWTLVENNVSQFITHMINKRKQKYLIPKDMMLFLKEQKLNTTVNAEFGWRNIGRIFYDNILPYFIDSLKEVIDQETKEDGTVVKTTYGIERYPDPMLMLEMEQYIEGLNVDRLVSQAALTAFIKIQIANRGCRKMTINEDDSDLHKSDKITTLNRSPFRNIGQSTKVGSMKVKGSPFRRIK